MIHRVDDLVLRKPEPRDADRLLQFKNDAEIGALLGGFSTGYTERDIEDWIDRRRTAARDLVWVIADSDDLCLGHVGLYEIDHRIRSAEFAIMIGDKAAWGKGLGTRLTQWTVEYAFRWLNLNRVQLSVLGTNPRAKRVYESVGFRSEGVLRQAQYKDGVYLDVSLMSVLRSEWGAGDSDAS